MKASLRCGSRRVAILSFALVCSTWMANAQVFCQPALGAEVLAYSFETGLEGFTNNGTGTTVSLDTIGATAGTNSLKFTQNLNATFTGMITTQINPTIVGGSTILGDPPGIDYVLFDLTLPTPLPPDPPGAGFARAGVTIFGNSQPDFPGGQLEGLEVQFFDNEISIAGPAGTYHDLRIDLASAFHPLAGTTGSFNDIFGTVGSGPNDILPVSFQIYINKNNTFPLTVYVDNIRFGNNPVPIPGDYNQDGAVDAADYVYWRKATDAGLDDLPNDNDDAGPVGTAEYSLWQTNFGAGASGGGGSTGAVPEPASGVLLLVAAGCYWSAKRKRTGR
jgi:hypothetical protein